MVHLLNNGVLSSGGHLFVVILAFEGTLSLVEFNLRGDQRGLDVEFVLVVLHQKIFLFRRVFSKSLIQLNFLEKLILDCFRKSRFLIIL